MRLLVVRHAIAEDRDSFARRNPNDDERPLTSEGSRKMERAALALASLVKDPDLLATSPLTRAQQTAAILARAYDGLVPIELAALAPGGGVKGCLAWLREQEEGSTIVIVGHEPELGVLASALLAPRARQFIELGKAGACLLDFDGAPAEGSATLSWLLRPRELRRLADR
jgi:phosphohistidine phosphatase